MRAIENARTLTAWMQIDTMSFHEKLKKLLIKSVNNLPYMVILFIRKKFKETL